MEDTAEKASIKVDITEKDLLTSLAFKETNYSILEQHLHKFRGACHDFLFLKFDAAKSKNIEVRLWEAHGKVNRKFRASLSRFQTAQTSKKLVEHRKIEKLYLEFIKSSIRFYRTYFQHLASGFTDIPEIFEIAQKANLNTLRNEASIHTGVTDKHSVLRSCHSTLIQLGDLWRYRETELKRKDRNWAPAEGYYDLAAVLDPSSGASFNQLAVIALADKDHLRAVYYLYRAICVENPAPQAHGNLELEFKKISSRYDQKRPLSSEGVEYSSEKLQSPFLYFHAQRSAQALVSQNEDLQNEILQLFADELRERPSDITIRKMCLINIAAEHCAANVVRETGSQLHAFKRLQSFNVATCFVLLKVLLDELQPPDKNKSNKLDDVAVYADRLTPTTRKILPQLRLYSAWFMTNVRFFIAQSGIQLDVHVHALWQIYTEALNLLLISFPMRRLPDVALLLDEDEETLAFAPFSDEVKTLHFRDSNGAVKPRWNQLTEAARMQDDEMLYRIKSMVKDALHLCRYRNSEKFQAGTIPLRFAGGQFIYQEDEEEYQVQKTVSKAPIHTHTNSAESINREDIDQANISRDTGLTKQISTNCADRSDTGVSTSSNSMMEDMVNNLVQSEISESSTTNDLSTPKLKVSNVSNFPSHPQQTLTIDRDTLTHLPKSPQLASTNAAHQLLQRPSLPSIWNTPFAPRPGETPGSSPTLPSAQTVSTTMTHSHIRANSRFSNADVSSNQQDVQVANSPWQSSPSRLSPNFDGSINLQTRMRPHEHFPRQSSVGQYLPFPPSQGFTGPVKSPPSTPTFGVIGESRSISGQMSPSGSSG